MMWRHIGLLVLGACLVGATDASTALKDQVHALMDLKHSLALDLHGLDHVQYVGVALLEQEGQTVPRLLIGHTPESSLHEKTPADVFGSHERLSAVAGHAMFVEHPMETEGTAKEDSVFAQESEEVDVKQISIGVRPGYAIGRCNRNRGTVGAVLYGRGGAKFILSNEHVIPQGSRVCRAMQVADSFGQVVMAAQVNYTNQGRLSVRSHLDVSVATISRRTSDYNIRVRSSCRAVYVRDGSLTNGITIRPSDGKLWIDHLIARTPVQKYGARTGHTQGRIIGFGDYCLDERRFNDPIAGRRRCLSWAENNYMIAHNTASEYFARRGDSGSTLLESSGRSNGVVVGLVSALSLASHSGGRAPPSFASPIGHVLEYINSRGLSGGPFTLCGRRAGTRRTRSTLASIPANLQPRATAPSPAPTRRPGRTPRPPRPRRRPRPRTRRRRQPKRGRSPARRGSTRRRRESSLNDPFNKHRIGLAPPAKL